MSKRKKTFTIIVCILILVVGFSAMKLFIKLKKEPVRKAVTNPGILVESFPAKKINTQVNIKVTGTVEAGNSIGIVPQVRGKIIQRAQLFERGGFFKKDDLFFKIDPSDYILASEISGAHVARAENDLLVMKGKAQVAIKEWEIAQTFNQTKAASPLVMYEPQLKKARAALTSAKAEYKKRLLDIERTKIKAPFNCIVKSETIEPGKFVSTGAGVAVIAGTDNFDVVVPVPLSELPFINIPAAGKNKKGSKATIILKEGITDYEWNSYILRYLGDVDPAGRMARILLRVPDPYNLTGRHGEDMLQLSEGMFVTALIEGKTLHDVFSIPPKVLRGNNTIWIITPENTLDIRKITIIRREKLRILIKGKINNNEHIILTNISGAAQGMKLRQNIRKIIQ